MSASSQRCLSILKQHSLLLLILLGVAAGVIVGFAIRPLHPSEDAKMWLGLPGDLYLRSLKMMIVPLIISSVITGAATLDPRSNGRISIVAFTFIYVTNLLGSLLGIVAFVVFKPGEGGVYDEDYNTGPSEPLHTQDIFADLLRNVVPSNLFEATFTQTQTKYVPIETLVNRSIPDGNVTISIQRQVGTGGGANLLGLIFASTFVGIAISSLKDEGRPLYLFFEAATKAVIRIIQWFMWLTPVGVLSLILVPVASIDDVGVLFGQLGMFCAGVIAMIAVQQLVVLPLILFVLTRRNPYYHLSVFARPWLVSFAAAGTAVTIPDMLDICENKLEVDQRVSRFVIPFSVTLSANGSAIFIVCSCLFISNLTGNSPTVATIFIVGILTSVSTLAIPSVPSASIVTILMILTSLDIPSEPIALLLTVEFLLDRLRTTSSLVSHTMCAVTTNHLCRSALIDTKHTPDEDVEIRVETVDKQSNDLQVDPSSKEHPIAYL